MNNLSLKEILLKSADFLERKWCSQAPLEPPLREEKSKARYEAELIISHFLNTPRMNIYLEFERVITKEIADKIRNAVVERGKRKPLQYIIGEVEFLDCLIEVNEDVLIPRPETEFMIDFIRQQESSVRGQMSILDMCTGSGAIAVALKKKFKDSTVYASDICEKALKVAQRNANRNECEIDFIKSDLFEGFKGKALMFDLIVCNPPYVSEEEYASLEPEIYFEPKIALVAENNGLYFYERVIRDAREFLNDNGTLYLEIGSEQADDVIKMATENKYAEYTVHKDLCDRNRIVRIKK